jgi:hypothetical protein
MYPWLGTVRRYGISRAMEVRSMRIQVTLQPVQKGAKKLLAQYGEQLVCARYRYDATRQRRLKAVELVVEETPWRPVREASKGAMMVGVRIDFQEVALQRRVKSAGGRWNPVRRLWELRHDQALKLGLKDRIEPAKVSIRRNCRASICINYSDYTYGNKRLHIDAGFYE